MTKNVSAEMRLSGLDTDTQLYGIFGVCRSGTTAVQKLLTLSGVLAYHQPIKSSLQRGVRDIDLNAHGQIAAETGRPVAIKETLGAYSIADCTFDPLDVIRRGTTAQNNLKTVFTLKEPFNNFLSWIKMASIAPPPKTGPLDTRQLLDNFILSSQTLATVFKTSLEHDVPTMVFDYESLKGGQAQSAGNVLLARLGINPNAYSAHSWSAQGGVDDSESGVVHLYPRGANSLHEQLNASKNFTYYAPAADLLAANMHQDVRDTLHASGVYHEYAGMLQHAA